MSDLYPECTEITCKNCGQPIIRDGLLDWVHPRDGRITNICDPRFVAPSFAAPIDESRRYITEETP